MEKNNIYASDISPKQQEIIYQLAQFTLLTSTQIQALLHHKDNKRSYVWLVDLVKRRYIRVLPFKQNNTKIFQLESTGMLLAQRLLSLHIKKRLSIKNISLITIDRYLLIADIYLQLMKDKETEKSNITYFTPITMPYDFFSITPDVYVTSQDLSYFLEIDRETQSMNVWQKKFEKYAEYYNTNHWKKLSPSYFPAVCVISITQQRVNKLSQLVELLFNTSTFAPIVFKFTTLDELLSQGSNEDICRVPFKKEKYTFL